MQTLLIVEDDAGIAAGLEYSLTQEGFGVVRCANRERRARAARGAPLRFGGAGSVPSRRRRIFDLPGGREKQRDMPVIFLTARTTREA